MGISVAELASRYPVLYHMASYESWPSIEKYGLLSSAMLVQLFEVGAADRERLLTAQRRSSADLRHPLHGNVTLRDQKPLSATSLQRCLVDCDAASWYTLLNERVFFWLNKQRLHTLMSAKEYSGNPHVVLHVDALSLVAAYANSIELAHMNTGNTRPFAHPRGKTTFRSMVQYPYEDRRKKPDYSAIVELTVPGGVKDIRQYVTRVEHALMVEGEYRTLETLFVRPDHCV